MTLAHKRTVDLKKRSKASRLPGFGGKAIARGSDDSFGRRAIYGAKDGRYRLGRADEILRLIRVLTFKIAKYYASRQEPSARTRFFVVKDLRETACRLSGLIEVKHGTLNARSFSDDAEYRAKMRRSIPISSASFSRDVTDAPRKAIS